MVKVGIDGAKGTGKSTLSSLLTETLNARHELVSYKHVYTPDEYAQLVSALPERDLVMERGVMSSWVYTWMRDGVFFCDDWYKPLSVSHFVQVIRAFDVFVILYASDPDVLVSRISTREQTTGKGMTRDERVELAQTNALFRMFGSFFANECQLKQVLMIDICGNDNDARTLSDRILEHARKTTGARPVPRNDLG